jgi:hypothetical protein
MQLNPSELAPTINTAEEILIAVARALQIRTGKDRIQVRADELPVPPVSLTYDVDTNGVTRCYIYAAIPININLSTSQLTEWQKCMELTIMEPPDGFTVPPSGG